MKRERPNSAVRRELQRLRIARRHWLSGQMHWGLPWCKGNCGRQWCEGCAVREWNAGYVAEIDAEIARLDGPPPPALTGELFALVNGRWVMADA